jgi:hypothetical protein
MSAFGGKADIDWTMRMSAYDPKRTFSTALLQSNTGRKSAEIPSGTDGCHFLMAISLRRGTAMKKLATAIAAIALIGTPAFAADMAVKAPPPAPAPVPTWTGFYGGIQFGGGWSDEAVNYSPNDVGAAAVLSGLAVSPSQPAVIGYRIAQSGPVGGFEAGYNWQAGSNWLVGGRGGL